MEKVMYVLRGPDPGGTDRYRDLVVGEMAPRLSESGIASLSIAVDDAASNVPSPVPTPPGEDPVVAVIGVELPCHDRRRRADEVVSGAGLEFAAYLVSGAVYTDYGDNEWSGPRTWADGDRSPSVLTVSFITSRPDISREDFLLRWHGTQSPLSAAIQPRQRYVRNEVIRPLTPRAQPLDGIVEEAWASAEVIEDPMQFFCSGGDPEVMSRNIEAMLDSVTAFIDMDRMRNVTMSEYLYTAITRRD